MKGFIQFLLWLLLFGTIFFDSVYFWSAEYQLLLIGLVILDLIGFYIVYLISRDNNRVH